MRIVIDMQGAQSTGSWNRGIGRYTVSLALAIVRNCQKNDEIILALNAAFTESLDRIRTIFSELLPPENIRIWSVLTPASHLDIGNNWRRETGELVREAFLANLNPDVVLISSLFEGLGDDAISSIKKFKTPFLTAVILYDLIPFIHKAPYLENPVVEKWYLEKIDYLKRADLWLAISESSSKEGVDYLRLPEDRCVNISTDADAQFQPLNINKSQENELRTKYNLHRSFIMYTGGIDHRKNIEGLIRAFALLPDNLRDGHQLAIVCSVQDHARDLLESIATNIGLKKDNLILTGYVPEEDLIALYNLCELFVFPSWHEGFGLPALEAMRCGAPVIAADATSLREVVGIEDALFDPHSDDAIAKLIERVLTDSEFREKLVLHANYQSKAFSWDKTGKRALAAMRQVIAEIESSRTFEQQKTDRPRLAYVSPLPPKKSGIADYSMELIPALSDFYNVEVIVNQEDVSDPWIIQNIPIRSVSWFLDNRKSFDRVLYHIGNSEFHKHMFGLLKEVPGIVVLHDFFLSNVLDWMDATGYSPGVFVDNIFRSHGYVSLFDLKSANDTANVVWKYPCSRFVFENSIGTIVHSEYSVRLAACWFGIDKNSVTVIPHLREPVAGNMQEQARKELGIAKDDFVVCSFGILGPTKLNHQLLRVWLDSRLSSSGVCKLIFVGENQEGFYGHELVSTIKNHPNGKSVKITGWVNHDLFKIYLGAADLGVQLRTLSRGETSGTVLDCMNFGLPTIINANGSMSDLLDEAVWKLPDNFTDEELATALETLWSDQNLRNKIGKRARSLILNEHAPYKCAQAYTAAIEDYYKKPKLSQLLEDVGKVDAPIIDDEEIAKLATKIERSIPITNHSQKIFVDVSELFLRDAKTGIQRVVRAILHEWLNNPPAGFHVEPVYATNEHDGYRYARKFTQSLLGTEFDILSDEFIEYASGDRFLCLDLEPQVQVTQRGFYQTLRNQGVIVKFVVYDLLCVLHPEYFPLGVSDRFSQWLEVVCENDGAICISQAVANELSIYRHDMQLGKRPFKIDWFHLGADINNSFPTCGLPLNSSKTLKELSGGIAFLMVGTLEPRKGHSQVIDSFEQLWRAGENVKLVIVGKPGWKMEQLIERINNHPEINRHLFWLEGISDEYLVKIYDACDCIIAASYGEGFGLPLIEAGQHKLSIIARDLPVFREVAGDYAFYFDGSNSNNLADSIREWLVLYRQDNHPKSDKMPWLTWQQSAAQLISHVI